MNTTPSTYGNGDTLYTNLTWEHGRQLTGLTTGGNSYTYAYDLNGIRTKKVVNGTTTHTYVAQNGKVVRETISTSSTTKVLDFIYDQSGRPFALKYSTNGGSSFTTYYYVLNLQGDVVMLVTTSGATAATYRYNAWGALVYSSGEDNIHEINPLRYRGYYYDSETGFYYVSSRYYDPEIGRFTNANSYTSTGQGFLGYNMFAYCLNNPVCRKDVLGETSVECKQDDGNPLDDDKDFHGASNGPNGGGVKIYRYGYDGPKKLVPSETDAKENSGLSFSTNAKPGSAVTTIEQINSTGRLYAVQDGRYHVSVYPIGGTISQWYSLGPNSPWTKALESVVIKN